MDRLETIVELMERFTAFEFLNAKQRAIVAGQSELVKIKSGSDIFKLNQIDSHDYFIVQGKVELVAADGKSYTLAHSSANASRPLANLRPRKYAATCIEDSAFLKLPHDLLSYILEAHNVEESREKLIEFANAELTPSMITMEIQQAIRRGELSIPSLPDVALRIQKYTAGDEHSIEDVVSVLMVDPAMVVKLIKYANGPLIRGVSPVETCSEAVIRLGINTTRKLVQIFSLQELFRSDQPELQETFRAMWQESVDVAVIAAVLAKHSQLNFEPEVAMLSGLLHKIGAMSIYAFASDYQGFLKLTESIESLVRDYEIQVACDIITNWQLGHVYFLCMKYLRHWEKPEVMTPDYSDLLNIALLHESIKKHHYHDLPKFHQLEAFKRIHVGESTPELSIKVLDESRQEISQLRQILLGN
ncbi:HDOD domain-containing protein [Pleionea litopenaei]|uniref:HDOD domain-containing protein n=1 Tax=Pleionea litopenaei TaxID=3070815 RepID=A0AA51RQD8_9GAMM|nr:HDOD domain-containing protein [Pleionea sp. HL-JVS1]WMS85722.1 HDOD domain-containing protein [Pleionea sp. HL-JVS1]